MTATAKDPTKSWEDYAVLSVKHCADMNKTICDTMSKGMDNLAQRQQASLNYQNDEVGLNFCCGHIHRCDGVDIEEMREWLPAVEDAVRLNSATKDHIPKIIARTASMGLYRGVMQYIEGETAAKRDVIWKGVRKYIEDNFAGANKKERLRLKVEQV